MNSHRDKILSIFCWNIANPSVERAAKQAEWLRKRNEDIFVLTEAKRSEGCLLLERYFHAYGFKVIFNKPEEKEFGVIIVSKLPMLPGNFFQSVKFLTTRVASAVVKFHDKEIELITTYIPSRDASPKKIERKKTFIKTLTNAFENNNPSPYTIFCGDFNILEPDHIPHYPFFENWEYEFYNNLSKYQLRDAFRFLHPNIHEYSWVGHTGDGYRYDHCFVSENLLGFLKECYYYHEPRKLFDENEKKLSDHSALITTFDL